MAKFMNNFRVGDIVKCRRYDYRDGYTTVVGLITKLKPPIMVVLLDTDKSEFGYKAEQMVEVHLAFCEKVEL